MKEQKLLLSQSKLNFGMDWDLLQGKRWNQLLLILTLLKMK